MQQTQATLNERLNYLKNLQKEQVADIEFSLKKINESFKLANIIRYSISGINSKDNNFEDESNVSAAGCLAGFLTKKIFVGNSKNPIKKALGEVIELIASNIILPKKN
jgi:hydroxylamine reductase (hybrid-cluster protein)